MGKYGTPGPPLRALRHGGALLATLTVAAASTGCADPATDDADGAGVSPRIVSMVPSLADITLALGGGEHLVARTDYDDHPALVGLPSVGGGLDPSYEALVGLGIDLVLMSPAREAAAMQARLEGLGIEMLTLPTNTVADIYGAIEGLGALLARDAAAVELSESLRTGFSGLEVRLAERRPVDVLYVLGTDPPLTTGGGTFVDELIRLAGGRNVFDDQPPVWPTVGFETIVARNPEVVLWPQSRDGSTTLDLIQAMPGWRDVPAVREGRVVFIDAASFNQPGPEMVESARSLAEALHPEVF